MVNSFACFVPVSLILQDSDGISSSLAFDSNSADSGHFGIVFLGLYRSTCFLVI